MAFFYLSSTSGDRIQAGTGKKCLKFQGKKTDLKVEKADLKQSPLKRFEGHPKAMSKTLLRNRRFDCYV